MEKKTVNIKQAEVQHKITELLISWLPQDNSQNRCIIRIIANRELQIDRQLVVEYAWCSESGCTLRWEFFVAICSLNVCWGSLMLAISLFRKVISTISIIPFQQHDLSRWQNNNSKDKQSNEQTFKWQFAILMYTDAALLPEHQINYFSENNKIMAHWHIQVSLLSISWTELYSTIMMKFSEYTQQNKMKPLSPIQPYGSTKPTSKNIFGSNTQQMQMKQPDLK